MRLKPIQKHRLPAIKECVLEAIKSIKYDNVLQDGTGIGMGLATAVNRLKDSKAKVK
jgi:Ca-activated chloride channel family protein